MKFNKKRMTVRIAVIPLLVVITILGLTGTSFGGEKAVSAAGANWLGTWQNRVQIAVDHTKIGSTLSDIPVMVHLSASSGENTANLTSVFQSLNSDSNRKKIAVTTSDGTTQCYVEIESWDSASGQAWVWVKIPSLSSSADTVLYLYYDAAQPDNTTYVGDTGSVAAQSVWSNHFVMVLHLNQSGSGASGEYIDSTSNGNNGRGGGGSSSATPIKVSSPFGSSQSFDGSNDYIEVPDNDAFSITTTGALTVSAWISPAVANFNGSDPYIRWMGKGNSSAQQEWQFVMYNQSDPSRSQWISFYTYSPSGGLGAGDYSTGAVATNSWVYVTGVAQSTSTTQGTESIYRNAAVHSGNPDSWQKYGLTYANGTAPVRIGMQYAGGGNFNGRIGEVTISNVTRSADWIKASYYSESDALLKYTVSASQPPTNQPPTNQPPVLNAVGNKSIAAGQALSFAVSASDADSVSLTYQASNLPAGATFNAATRTFSWTPGASQVGVFTNVGFTVSDGSSTDSEAIAITVTSTPTNQPPVLNPVGNKSIAAGQALSFAVSASDADSSSLIYQASNLPAGATFNAATRTFSWTPGSSQVGVFTNVVFTVSDGTSADSEAIAITVSNTSTNQLNQSYAGDKSTYETFGNGGSYTATGQTFTPSQNLMLSDLKVNLYRDTGTGGNIYSDIFATSGGKPTGSSLGQAVIAADIGKTWALRDFSFSTPVSLSGGVQYAVVLTTNAGNKIYIGLDNTAPTYSGGTWIAKPSATWNSPYTGYDALFEIWGRTS